MKKISFLIPIMTVITILSPFSVMAQETSNNMSPIATDSVSNEKTDTSDEASTGGTGKFGGGKYNTYEEMLDASRATTLTSDEAAEGYTIIEGFKYSAEDAAGDAPETIKGGDTSTGRTGYVTFVAQIPEQIHEEVYITVINMNTFREYSTSLFEVNDYSSCIGLPAGIYQIETAGLTADTQGRFYADSQQFTITTGSSSILNFELLDSKGEYSYSEASDVSSVQESVATTESTEIVQESNKTIITVDSTENNSKKISVVGIILSIITIAGIIAAIIFLIKKIGIKSKDHRGFDEL